MDRRKLLLFGLFAALGRYASAASADELSICYNYGCHAKAQIQFSESQLDSLRQLLAAAADAEAERVTISNAIGRMYAIAGEQTPVWRDKARNYADGGVDGQMDCIDHSNNTDAFLRLLQARGWIRFHEVLEPIRRLSFFFAVHWSARIRDRESQGTFAVDSWYVDNGRPALVIPVEDWRFGRIPDGA